MASQAHQITRVFHALGDPTRRAVVERLSRGPAGMTELAKPFGMALPSFAQHLKLLEGCGIVRSYKQGRVRTFNLVSNALQPAEGWLREQRALWEQRLDQLDGYLLSLKEKQ